MKIKSFLIVVVLTIAILCFGVAAKAQTTDVQALIAQLQSQIAQLTQQTAQLQAQQGATTTWCHTFDINLKIGSKNNEVPYLKTALIKEGLLKDSKNQNNVFDGQTFLAVIKFQEKYASDILTPLKLKHGTGNFDSTTRKKMNALYGCGTIPTFTPTSVSPPTAKSAPAESWVIVFTHRGTLLPNEVINFICDTVKSNVISWIDREFTKNQITKPFDNVVCSSDQILLSEKQLLGGEEMAGEGATFTNPINTSETIKFLENKAPSLIKEKYITVFHYLVPTELQFTNYQYSPKYDFEFITTFNLPDGEMVFVPPLTDIDIYSRELVHEFMHKIGATDKYFIGFQQACK